MFQCVRLRSAEDDDLMSKLTAAKSISFRETASRRSFEWHPDPEPRYVTTLSGTLEFETKRGAKFTLRPGHIFIAQNNAGSSRNSGHSSGHSSGHNLDLTFGLTWRLINTEPWRRPYVVYTRGGDLGFVPSNPYSFTIKAASCPSRLIKIPMSC